MDSQEQDLLAEEFFRKTVQGLSPKVRMDMLVRLGSSSLDTNLSSRDQEVLKRCMQIIREFNGPP